MRWKRIPALGAACAVLLVGCCPMAEYHVPAGAGDRDTEETLILCTEPSDPKAPSVDRAETVSARDDEMAFSRCYGRLQKPDGQPAWCMEEAVHQWALGLQGSGRKSACALEEAVRRCELYVQKDFGQSSRNRTGGAGALFEQSVQSRTGDGCGSSRQSAQNRTDTAGRSIHSSGQVWYGESASLSELSSGVQGGSSGEHIGDSGERELFKTDGMAGAGPIRKSFSASDLPPEDTVAYTDSRKQEIMETRYVQSVIDPGDPSTYKVVEEKEEVPILYLNQAGDIKYAYEDGKWYEYRYCSGTVMLDEKDQDTALKLLNYRGEYDNFEVIYVNCRESDAGSQALRYQYQVRYRGKFAMERAPEELDRFTCMDPVTVAATMTMKREKRIPVLVERTFGTGAYRYYGWQEQGEKVFYFDEHGEKITGSQVIRGIRHIFDEQGVRISTAGVEVSEENGTVDWEKVAASRIDTAMIRCAYRASDTGMLVPDAQTERNLRGAGQAGLETGISLFSQAVTMSEAVEEAEYLIRLADEYRITGPVAITVSFANPEHNGRADMLEREERTKYIAACCQTLREAGYAPMIHTDEAFLSDSLLMEELTDCRLWLTACGKDLTYTGSCEIWQYTDRGTVDGMSGYAGLYISYGK